MEFYHLLKPKKFTVHDKYTSGVQVERATDRRTYPTDPSFSRITNGSPYTNDETYFLNFVPHCPRCFDFK